MKLNNNKIRQFFSIFWKNINKKELEIIKWKLSWNLDKNQKSHSLIQKVNKYKFIFQLSPFIKEVFICNNIAFWSANSDSDIDLFIITKNDKIWTARLLLSFFIHIFWLRRYSNKRKWRFCLSFWASEDWWNQLSTLQIEKNNDPYLAIWTATLIPILNKQYTQHFQNNNKWIYSYWINFINKKLNKQSECCLNKIITLINNILEILFYPKIIENILKKILIKRATNKQKYIKNLNWTIISDKYLKFHDKDIRRKIKKILD